MEISSPFISEVGECKLIMRRLRKKISKYSNAHKEAKKSRDQCNDILNILKGRNLPPFVMETIKKRRTFDLISLKNVVMVGESSLGDMVSLVDSQEAEISALFAEHKQRLRKNRDKLNPKLERRSTNYSSTEEESSQVSDSDEGGSFQFHNYFEDGRSTAKEENT